ncbi:nose resistant to fluoxetine protein 6 [Anabrus simplex]|uniref:nose resistant to fluoxetine protein 6 n=1 Tax=Anabrus simplex TaxID=316456 RepID=UPI0035A3BC1B
MRCYCLLPVSYLLLICGLSSGQMCMERTSLGSEAANKRLALQEFLAHQLASQALLSPGMNNTVITSRKYATLKEPCKSHMNYYETSYNSGQQWAMYMYDASTKFPESVLMGNLMVLGNYDECINVRDVKALDGSTFHGQHCLIAAVIVPRMKSKGATPDLQIPTVSLAACLPSTCDLEDSALIVQEDFKERLTTVSPLFNYVDVYTGAVDKCHTKEELELDSKDWTFTGVLIAVAVLVVLSTAYDLFTLHSESRINLLIAFSVYTNGSKLFAISTSGSGSTIHCLHGIRFFSMAWVIVGHRYGSIVSLPSINPGRYGDKIYAEWKYLWITNATLSVDTFFVLSGLLVAYVFFQTVPKTNSFNIPMYYLHRYIRLTPAVAVMILLHNSLLRHAGTGPMWDMIQKAIGNSCPDNWWITLLYVQNYVKVSKQCIIQAWYLSVDMQLFWLSPLVLIPLWKWPKIGLGFAGALSIAGIISNFVISYVNEFSGTRVGPTARHVAELDKLLYYPTHARFVVYLLGICLGYLLVSLKSMKITIRIPKVVTLLLWLVAGGLLLLTLFIVHVFQQPDYEFNKISAAFYNALGRPGWGLGIAMVIFLCHTGHGGVIDSFLSWPWFQPLSRLTYSMYLVHIPLQMVNVSAMRTLYYLSDDNIMREFFGDLVISLLLAIVLTLTFESPFIVLEKELLSGRKKKRIESTDAAAVVRTSQTNDEQVRGEVSEEQPKEVLKV